jgi:predicted Zn-dependent protease
MGELSQHLIFNSTSFPTSTSTSTSQYFSRASQLDPLHPLPFVNAARTYTQLSQPTNSAAHLATAIARDPALATTR